MENNYKKLKEILRAGDVFDPMLEDMYTPEEMRLVERFGLERFTEAAAQELLGGPVVELLESAYRAGKLNKFPEDAPPSYAMAEMYYYLDCYVLRDEKRWWSYPQELIDAVDAWYFGEYSKRAERRLQSEEDKPTEIVLPLEQALEYIDKLPYDLYLLPCDCSTIARSYDAPKAVCIQSVMPAVNTLMDRGLGKKITKEEAKEVVRQCDNEGLIHSPTSYHFCNCGPQYCYPFRCSADRGCRREWPKSFYVARVDARACVGCRQCVKRCPVDAIRMEEKKAVVNESVCVGCGLCRVPCRKNAIVMHES